MTTMISGSDGEPTHAPPGFLLWVSSLVRAHRGRLLAYARRRGLDAEEALDAVQDSFLSFLKLPEARGVARAEGDEALKLLTVILRHHTLNRRRKIGRRGRVTDETAFDVAVERVDSGAESSEAIISRAEELARVEGCILRMQRLQRLVVKLSLLDEQPHAEIAKTLGLSEGHVRVLLHRAREHVRHCPTTEAAVEGDPFDVV